MEVFSHAAHFAATTQTPVRAVRLNNLGGALFLLFAIRAGPSTAPSGQVLRKTKFQLRMEEDAEDEGEGEEEEEEESGDYRHVHQPAFRGGGAREPRAAAKVEKVRDGTDVHRGMATARSRGEGPGFLSSAELQQKGKAGIKDKEGGEEERGRERDRKREGERETQPRGDSEVVEELNSGVRFWTDYLKAPLGQHNVAQASGRWWEGTECVAVDGGGFGQWEDAAGREAVEEWEDHVRWFAEASDHMQVGIRCW